MCLMLGTCSDMTLAVERGVNNNLLTNDRPTAKLANQQTMFPHRSQICRFLHDFVVFLSRDGANVIDVIKSNKM